VGFTPNNTDLPHFIYQQTNPNSKSGLLSLNGLISMETPVVYFYTDRETKVSLKVDFPRGWITDWYPFAAVAPSVKATRSDKTGGQTIRWDARLLPGEPTTFARDRNDEKNHYFRARDTDAVPLQVEAPYPEDRREYDLRGGAVVQREKFLFYRGVGSFAPPVSVQALGGGRVRVRNAAGEKVGGLALITVQNGQVGFHPMPEIDSGAEALATLPACDGKRSELADYLVKQLTTAGLYEKEARAMVKTWDTAWFGEEGSRLLYLVPRARTDELLPVTINPKPTEVVRVLVGRHDFLTPEQEATADRELKRFNAAQLELAAAQKELDKLGRFSWEARRLAKLRLEAATITASQK